MYSHNLSYSSLDGILSHINYAVAGRIENPTGIDYLITNQTIFEEPAPYNKKFDVSVPIQLKSDIYSTQETPFYRRHERHYDSARAHQQYYFSPDSFLRPDRKPARFIGDVGEIKEMVEESFKAVVKQELPEDLTISVVSRNDMVNIHTRFGPWNEGIMGFSLNANGKGTSHIFVREGPLDGVLITIGHELGHILTHTIDVGKDEEAKAFAFCFAWVKAIKEENVGNLGDSIDLNIQPAANNLHDVAFDFVRKKINSGILPLTLHWDIVKRYVSLLEQFYNST